MTSLSSKSLPPHAIVAETIRSHPPSELGPSLRRGPKIIELFGLPGAGKTTLVTAVDNHNQRWELTAAWKRLPRLRRSAILLGSLVDIRCLGGAVRFALRARLSNLESLMRLFRLITKTHWMRSQQGQMLLDESFLQEIWSICVAAGRHDPEEAALARFIRCLYSGLDADIVFVEADEAIASKRVSGRTHGRSRLDGLAAAEVEARLTRTARLPHAIVAAAKAAGLSIERIDGRNRIEANADRLRKLLAAHPGEPDGD